MKQVEIKFKIRNRDYDQYEGILQEFLNYMNDLGYSNIEVYENEEQDG